MIKTGPHCHSRSPNPHNSRHWRQHRVHSLLQCLPPEIPAQRNPLHPRRHDAPTQYHLFRSYPDRYQTKRRVPFEELHNIPGIGMNETRYAIVVEAGKMAYAQSYRWVYLTSIAFGGTSALASVFLGDIGHYMDDHVAVVM